MGESGYWPRAMAGDSAKNSTKDAEGIRQLWLVSLAPFRASEPGNR